MLSKLTMDQGNLMSVTAEVRTQIASFNTNNEFNRAINEQDMDFKIPGVPHSTVKQLQSASVRELIQKIENHPNRHALQRDLQQSQSFNPFSQESKQMIHEVGNIELCELLDMEPKAQCKVCLSYWDVGIVYCTCGHFLRNGTEENKRFVQYTMDLLSIPNYYIKKGRPHGHRYGRKPGDHEYFIARRNARRRTSWVSTTGSSATRSSARICLTSVALKNYVVRWPNWRTKTTRTTSLQKKLVCTETIGGSVRTQLVLIRCQLGIDLTSSKHCQVCDSSNTKKIQLMAQVLSAFHIHPWSSTWRTLFDSPSPFSSTSSQIGRQFQQFASDCQRLFHHVACNSLPAGTL